MANPEDDPEVQKNGFETIAEAFSLPDDFNEEFFKDEFDESADWDENLDAFFDRCRGIHDTVMNNEDEIRESFDPADEDGE